MFQGGMDRIRSAWLLVVAMAMVAFVTAYPAPAEAQPRSRIAPCERVLFAAFYAASVEGVPQSGLTTCLSGASQPRNRVFASWSEAPRLLRHLEHIDGRLLSGVTRENLPSPGEVALANYGALIARCELVEETPDAGAEVDASADADADTATSRHRSRVRLSHSAMRHHAWDPFAWFPSRCARRLSIEIRPAEAVMVSHVVRNDVFVAEATRRLADPAHELGSIPAIVTGLQSRLADTTGDPIPSSLFPPLASACLGTIAALPATCFTAVPGESASPAADAGVTRELARLRTENNRLTEENRGLRASNTERSRTLTLWLGILGFLALFAIWAARISKRAPQMNIEDDAGSTNSAPPIILPAPPTGEEVRQYYEGAEIPRILHERELEERRHFETLIARHKEQLADEVDKLRTAEGELTRCRTALRLLQESLAMPDEDTPILTGDGWDAFVSGIQSKEVATPSLAEIDGKPVEPAPIESIEAVAEPARHLVELVGDLLRDDDPRREVLKAQEPITAEVLRIACTVMIEWREQIEAAFGKAPASDPGHRDTLSMGEPEPDPNHGSAVVAEDPHETGPKRHTTLRDFLAVSPPPAEPE